MPCRAEGGVAPGREQDGHRGDGEGTKVDKGLLSPFWESAQGREDEVR